MALTVRPDDEVYQFDTVWLGPDEYTLPIQARYVAWGTWLACFLVATVVLIPIGGNGPAGVLGSLIWSLGLSVVLSRAVMLVVDHERPLRSLPALFSAEARAALAARRRSERALLVRPGKIGVRETPPKVLAMRERQRVRTAAKADRRRPAVSAELAVVEPVQAPEEPAWTPDLPVDEWCSEPAWSVSADDREDYEVAPVPAWSMPAGERYVADPAPAEPEVHEFVRAPDPEPAHAKHAAPEPMFTPVAAAVPAGPSAAPPAAPAARTAAPAAPSAQHAAPAARPAAPAAQHAAPAARPAAQHAVPAARPAAPAAQHAATAGPAARPGASVGRVRSSGAHIADPATRPEARSARAEDPAARPAVPAAGRTRADQPSAVQGWTGTGAWPAPQARAAAHARAAADAQPPAAARADAVVEPEKRPSPFRADPQEPERPDAYRGPVTVDPDEGKHEKPRTGRDRDPDPHAALEARILLPARKDR